MTATIASRAEEIFLSDKEVQILRQRLLFLLISLYEQGYTEFYTSCAWGVPLWSAELILLMKKSYPDMLLHLALPYPGQADRWETSMKKRWLNVIQSADSAVYLAADAEGFRKADEFMTSRSDLLLYYGKQGFLNYSLPNQSAWIELCARKMHIPVRYL